MALIDLLIDDVQQFKLLSPIGIGLLVLAALGLIALFIGLIFLLTMNTKKKSQRQKEQKDFNVRIYSYDYVKESFYYFDKMNISNARQFTKEEFYSQFSRLDRYLVENWLNDIAANKKHADFLQADINLTQNGKTMSSMLELTSVNKERNIIHFDSHLLPFIYSINNVKGKKNRIQRIPKKYILSTVEDAQHFLDDGKNDAIGATYFFKLYRKDEKVQLEEEYKKLSEINAKLTVSLVKFLSKTRKLVRISPTEEIILDTGSISKMSAMTTAFTIQNSLQQVLNLQLQEDENYYLAIGLTNGTYSQKNYTLAKEQSGKMADAIIKGLTNEKILFYDEAFFINYQQSKAQKDEVRMVLKNSTFRTYFSPTLNTETGNQDFYMVHIKPFGTSVSDIEGVISIAKEMNKGCFTLFKSIKDRCQAMAKAKREKVTLAIHIPYANLNDFVKAIDYREEDNIRWLIILDETDLLTCLDDPNTIADNIESIKEQGYLVGVIIRNPSSGLRAKILRTASYFFVPPVFITPTNENDTYRSRNDLRNIQLSYGPYKASLVFFGLKDNEDIELGVYYSGTIFECTELGLPSSHFENLSDKEVENIMEKTKNLRSKSENNIMNVLFNVENSNLNN